MPPLSQPDETACPVDRTECAADPDNPNQGMADLGREVLANEDVAAYERRVREDAFTPLSPLCQRRVGLWRRVSDG